MDFIFNQELLIGWLHLYSTLLMTGLIWVIQWVHYPSFLYIDKRKFVDFEKFHSKQISKIVVPLMILEFFTAVGLVFNQNIPQIPSVINLFLLLTTWAVTFSISVPLHRQLMEGWNSSVILKLVYTNGIRTVLWTLRSLLVMNLVAVVK